MSAVISSENSDYIGMLYLDDFGKKIPDELQSHLDAGKIKILETFNNRVFFQADCSIVPSLKKYCLWEPITLTPPVKTGGSCPYRERGYYQLSLPQIKLPSWLKEMEELDVKWIERISYTQPNDILLVFLEPKQIQALWEKPYVKNLEPYTTPYKADMILENSIQKHKPVMIRVRQKEEVALVKAILAKYKVESLLIEGERIQVTFKDESGMKAVEEIAKLGCALFIEGHYTRFPHYVY